jgi:hypothetical protein
MVRDDGEGSASLMPNVHNPVFYIFYNKLRNHQADRAALIRKIVHIIRDDCAHIFA